MKDDREITNYELRITKKGDSVFGRLSGFIIHHSSFIILILLIVFAFRTAGCQFDVTGNPDVSLLRVRVSPGIAAVPVNGRLLLTAMVTGSQQSNGITWTIVGSNNGSWEGGKNTGLTVTYLAPAIPAALQGEL